MVADAHVDECSAGTHATPFTRTLQNVIESDKTLQNERKLDPKEEKRRRAQTLFPGAACTLFLLQ